VLHIITLAGDSVQQVQYAGVIDWAPGNLTAR
jgi:hypothetical protein